MKKHERTSTYRRDVLGRGGRQYILPWGAGKTISTIEAAERLGVCHDTVRTMCESGEIQGWQIRDVKNSPWRVSVDSVEIYIERKIAKYDTSGLDPKMRPGLPKLQSRTKLPTR